MADTSVWARVHREAVGSRLADLIDRHLIWTCRMVDLEVTQGTRARDVAAVLEERLLLPDAPIGEQTMNRALQIAGLLAKIGLHRAVGPADLVIAAAAEASNLTLLHYDADFDRIASVTGQPAEWIAEPGSLD